VFRPPESDFDIKAQHRAGLAAGGLTEYPGFDWLRIVLASGVFWVHAGSVSHLNFAGDLFVQVFFALSGFLIGGIILRMNRADLPRFFYNRTIRIWLPFFAAVGALYGAAYLKEGFAPYFWQALLYDLTFTHNYFIAKTPEVIAALPMHGTGSHFWSISVEEQFYLLAPLLILFVSFAKYWMTWVAIAVAATLFETWYGSVSFGVLAAMLQRRFGNWHIRTWAIAALVGTCAVTVAFWATDAVPYRLYVPLLAISVVLLCARPGQRTRFGSWAGGISFPMYLNHWMGLFIASAIASRLPAIGVVTADIIGFAIAIGIAAYAYKLIDLNLYRYRAAWYSPALGYASMVAVYVLMMLGLVLGFYLVGPLDAAPSGA
jgi:peptidoglycan/LPS O-acetylase OafA/YrhL